MKKQLTILSLVTLFIGGCFGAQKAHADFSLGVYPPITTITTTAPNIINTVISFSNTGDTPIDGDLRIVPFKASDDGTGLPSYMDHFTGPDAQIAQKISLSITNAPVTSLTIPPQSKRDVTLTVTLPENEPDGDYYFSVIYTSKPITNNQSTSTFLNASIASHVLLSIGANHKPQGNIDTFDTPIFVTGGPLPITVKVANTGNAFFAPRGAITIKNMFGQTVGAINLLPVNILAQSIRDLPSDEISNTSEESKPVWHEKALFGVYQVQLSVALSDQGPLYTQTRYVIAIPWIAIGTIIIMSLLGLFIFLRVKKRTS